MVLLRIDLVNKKITVYFQDGSQQHIGRKDGIFLELTNSTLILRNTQGVIEGIPISKIIRFIEKTREEVNNW